MPIKSGFIDKLIARMDRLDAGSLQTQFLRLAGEKGLLETIFHAIQEGILVLDGKGSITYANRATERLLGINLEEAVGQPIQRYLREVEWDLVLNLDDEEWSRLVSREIELTYPEHRFIDFYVVPLSLVNADEQGAVLILRDVTRERENQASTMESEKLHALTLLAAGVAHEIGNPLNSLNIHLQLMQRELKHLPDEDRENLTELLQVASQEVERLDHIIHQFLRAVRPTQPQREPSEIKTLLKESLQILRQEIGDRGVLIAEEYADDLPSVQVDRGQIKQAFFNVTKNAMEAMSQGGILKISAFSEGPLVGIAFKDTGSGISPEQLGSIFDAYHTTKATGSGLGLMIVQRIIREHGGQIEVDSAPGKGTTIILYLPTEEQRLRLLKAPRNTNDTAPPEEPHP
jgi:two-component system, sporulation sensor kinase E